MNFLYFSTLNFDEAGGAHNPTQIARALARRGARVLFVEPQPSARRQAEHLPLEIVALTELGMTPSELRRAWFGLETGELETVARALRARIGLFDANTARAAIYSAPFDPYVRLAPLLRAQNFSLVYYAMDDFAAAPALGYTQFAPSAEEYLVRHADLLCAVTPHAAQTLERFGKPARVIPNGVDIGAFQSNPSVSRAQIERGELTLGFWGTLMDSLFDADLVAYVARTRPRWKIHLLGATDPEPHRPSVVARLNQCANVIFHGAAPHAELPRYAAAFDAALAPFPDNAFTRGRDPLKVYEYLAAHLPVAASYASQLASLPYVFVAQSPDEFVSAIEQAARTQVDQRALDEFLAPRTWAARAAQLGDAVRDISSHAQTGDANVLPSFAQPDAQAVMRYAAALERELEQVQAWARELEKIAQARGGWKRFVPTIGKRN